MSNLFEIQAGAPTSTPNFKGKFSINTTSGALYYSKDTVSAADWVEVPSAAVFALLTGAAFSGLVSAPNLTVGAAGVGVLDVQCAQTYFNDHLVEQGMFKASSGTVYGKGNIASTSTVTFNRLHGNTQTFTCAGAYTLTFDFAGWPATGKSYIEVQATNMGLGTLAFAGTVNWKKKDDTYTTTFGTYLTDRGGEAALKAAGLDTFLFWSQDAGTTVYGTML